jgi:competence protein ComFC
MQLRDFFRTIGFLSDLFYPKICHCCQVNLVDGEKHICLTCFHDLPIIPNLPGNSSSVNSLIGGKFPFLHSYSFLYYYKRGISGKLLKEIKYFKDPELAFFMGGLFGKYLKSDPSLKSVDCIVPVPLHPKRMKWRGFNQSQLIAEGMSHQLQIPVARELLIRVKYSKSQTTKMREERIKSGTSAYQLKAFEPFHSKHVILLDDVITTGSTLQSCATSLLSIPGIKISVAALCSPYG